MSFLKKNNSSQNAEKKPVKRHHKLSRGRERASILIIEIIIPIVDAVLVAATLGMIIWLISLNSAWWLIYYLGLLAMEIILMIILRVRRYHQSQRADNIPHNTPDTKTLKKIKTLLKVQNRTIAEPRPELSVDKIIFNLVPNQQPRVILHITNRGNITAYNLNIQSSCIIHFLSFEGMLPTNDRESDYRHPEIAPTATISAILTLERPISTEVCRDVEDGKLNMFYYFQGRYKDKNGDTFTLNRVYMYDPRLRSLKIASDKYWQEGDKEEKPN